MMPFDGATSSQQSSQHVGVAPAIPRPPMAPGHHGAPSPVINQPHHGQMNTGFPNMHRQPSSGPNFQVPPSPSSRQNSFGGVPNGSGHYQAHSQPSHHQIRSPSHQQQHNMHSMHGQGGGQGSHHQTHPQHMGMSGGSQHPNMGSSGMHENRQRSNNYIATGMTGNWQSDKDMPHRREMIQQIVKMLKKDKNGSPEWLSKLPQMAKQLEVSLYRNARSFDDYMDMSTLKQRLQMIAMEVSRKAKSGSSSSSSNDRHRNDDRNNNMYTNNGMHSGSQRGSQSSYMNNHAPSMQSNHQQQDMRSGGMQSHNRGSQMVNLDDVNPTLTPGNDLRGNSNNFGGSSTMHDNGRSSQSSRNNNSSAIPQRNDPEWKIRIRHKQQRLLLLHHSAKCPHDNGTCNVTPHCADMKRLWRHMEGCKDNECRVAHCFSSRAILSHYRKCKDPQCPACGPVRETVRKSSKTSGQNSQGQRARSNQIRPSQNNMMQNQLGNNFPNMNGGSSSHGNTGMITASPDPIAPSFNTLPQPQSQSRPQSISSHQMPPPMGGVPAPPDLSFKMSSQQNLYQDQPKLDPISKPSMSRQQVPSTTSSSSGNDKSRGRDSTEWQKVRHKQQRLLLLRHASKCQYESGKCPVTPHCAPMKKLWEHIAHCKNQQCTVQHCMSSRYVLSHYRRCKDPRCPACGPVRETIRKSSRDGGQLPDLSEPGVKALDLGTPVKSLDIGTPPFIQSQQLKPTTSESSPPVEPLMKRIKMEKPPSRSPIPPPSDQNDSNAPALQSSSKPMRPPQIPSKQPQQSVSTVKPQQSVKSNAATKVDDHSLLNSFTTEEIELHLASLHKAVQLPPAKLKAKCGEVLKGLQSHQHGWVFNTPVDPVELGLPDYFEIVKKPMDLGTVSKKLDSGTYHFIADFASDVKLTFENAMTYNEEESVVHDMAKELKIKFVADHKKLMTELELEDKEARKNDRACTLCGCEKLNFEPPVFFCNGMNCQSTRIRRNSHFYIGGNNQYYWCNTCYNELDGSIPIELVDMSVMKNDLKKKKNDEVHEESWVQCDECENWIHQICGLFNTRQNKEPNSKFFCPKCLLNKRKNGLPMQPRPPSAADLPRTKLSEYLERHVHRKVSEKKSSIANEKMESERVAMTEAMRQLECGTITIRQVTATDRKLEVRELMKKRYAHKNYPDEFPFRCKCIIVFQRIDGVDVVLFALYLYEHGDDNPDPNKRCVYVSYLDSVHFMRPRQLRTFVYHEILICYLDYARKKGFATAHIWACPPLKGDDYIFYAKPEDQKTPKDARLRQWYLDMLEDCQKREICGKVTNMYDLYFANEDLDGTVVPYLEGDYFPGEAEIIIKDIESGAGKKGGSGGKKSKKKSNKSKGRGNRSDDDSPYGEKDTSLPPKSYKEGGRDEVMVKLGETIHPMKESFIVAFLNWSGVKLEDQVVPEKIQEYRKKAEEDGSAKLERENRKRDLDGDEKNDNPSQIKVIDDDDEDMDCEFLNNRQAFLNLCRGNHYQFDELRRAKHTSMMVLWHLHNRDAPKFVQQCASCSREILTGIRYHCNTCPEYDLCEECYKNPKANRGACTHDLQAITVEVEKENQSGGTNGLTEAQRRERQRNLQLHIQLIEHASRCTSSSCGSSNCAKMKSYLKHGRTCKLKASGGCKICKRIWTLLRIHAQKCKDTVCPIPQCMAIREKIRQLAKQQQAMDDRRRQEMNRAFRMSISGAQVG